PHVNRKGKSAQSPIQIGVIIAILLILGSIAVYVLFPLGNFTLSNASSSSQQPTPTPTIGPASSAIVSIVPLRTMQQGTYTITAITGTPNGAKQQVFAHTVTATTAPVSKTVNATGHGTIVGVSAHGTL